MNEFVAFLKVLWEIVRFFLELASYAICFLLAMLASILPWRAVCIIKAASEGDLDRGDCIFQFFRTLLEVVACAFLLPSLAIPTRLVGFVHLLGDAEAREQLVHKDKCDYILYFLASPFEGIFELVGMVMALLAVLSVVRFPSLIEEVGKELKIDSNWNKALFNGELVAACTANGALALVDLVLLPLLLVLGVTVWRAPPVIRAMRRGASAEMQRVIIFRQFARLITDVFLVGPSALLVLLSAYRLPPLLRRLRSDPESAALEALEEGSPSTETVCCQAFQPEPIQRELLRAGGLILLDIICLPMSLPLLMTGYRARAIMGDLPGTAFHLAVREQFVELLADLPFLLAGFLVICSVYRADLILRLCRSDAGSAEDRRKAAAWQLARLAGDVASLLPCALILCTFYRVCTLVLGLKAGMARMLREEAEMHLREWQFDMPRPKGRPRVVLRAAKSPNLGDVTGMQLQVAGDGFWEAVAEVHGGMAATVGRAMLPLRLKDGKEVDFGAVQRGRVDVELVIELDVNVKQSSVLKFLQKLPADVELLLQLEATVDAGRRKSVLLAVPIRLADLVEAVSTEDFRFQVQDGAADAEAAAQRLAALRGEPKLRRDKWFPIVMTEFLQLAVDLVHLLIALLLVAAPWRLAAAVHQFLEPNARREARPVRKAAAALRAWDQACDRIMARADRVANRYTKAAAEEACRPTCQKPPGHSRSTVHRGSSETGAENCVGVCCCIFFPCCPNYNDWDEEDWEVVRSDGQCIGRRGVLEEDYGRQLKKLGASLKFFRTLIRDARKAWPDSPAWAELSVMIDVHLQRRSEAFFWMLLLHEVHILVVKHSITGEEHARVSQAIRNRALPLVQGAAGDSERLQDAVRLQIQAASKEGKCGLKGKSKTLLFKILRSQLKRTVTDFIALLFMLLLVATGYRLPRIWREVDRTSELAYLKAVVQREAFCLAQDLLRLLQLLLLTALLVATVVKLPDFLSHLRPALGLRKARDCALASAVELVVGIGELLLMLTAWKTYRLLVSAVVFGALCPAAMLATALPGVGTQTRYRFALASVCWLALVLVGFFVKGTYTMVTLLVLMVLAFVGFCFNRIAGWTKPRGGRDWWSPVVRCTLPNLLALFAIACDAAVLASEGLQPGAIGGLGAAASIPALVVATLAVLLETIPMVSPETDQEGIVMSHGWRLASTFCKEVLFMPVAAALAPTAMDSPAHCMALAFYTAVALLGPTAWDFDLPYELQLDIRCVSLCACGRRTLMLSAVLASVLSQPGIFLAFAVGSGVWAMSWAPCGCPALWPEVLRLGVSVGAVVAAATTSRSAAEFEDWTATLAVWGGAGALALCVGVASWEWRRRRLAASKLPTAMAHLAELQRRLCLWGGEALPALRADTDVNSTARRVLEFEERLPMERLDLQFFAERHAWRRDLTDAKDYDMLLTHLERLKTMIREPVTRVLLRQVLANCSTASRKQLGPTLANEIVSFVVPKWEMALPPSVKGWEYGRLDLEELRSAAAAKAARIPASVCTRSRVRPSKLGRPRLVQRPSTVSMTTP